MKAMSLDDRFADLRTAMDAEIRRARRLAIADLVMLVSRMRANSNDERAAALCEAGRIFPDDPALLELLKNFVPPIGRDETDLRAQRFARVRVAEIQLYHAAQLNTGRAASDVYKALKPQMDAAREAYREKILTPAHGTADHLHAEFVRTLANNDAALLGPEYPGPLV
jgi:hypothetical protein